MRNQKTSGLEPAALMAHVYSHSAGCSGLICQANLADIHGEKNSE